MFYISPHLIPIPSSWHHPFCFWFESLESTPHWAPSSHLIPPHPNPAPSLPSCDQQSAASQMHISSCNHEAQYFPLFCQQLHVPRQTLPLTVFSVQSLHLFFAIASALPSMWKALLPPGHLGDCFTPGLSLHVPMCKAFYTHWVN